MENRKKIASFRFYSYLNELLPKENRNNTFQLEFRGRQSVKHLIESCGIPHTEVNLILANSEAAGFSYIAQMGDFFSIYPHFYQLPITTNEKLQPGWSGTPSFIVDGHLGQLARYLRMLGFDTSYKNQLDDRQLADLSDIEGRILLTRDRGLLKRKMVIFGCLIRYLNPLDQLQQVVARFNLMEGRRPFSRCIACNGILEPVRKEEILDLLEPKTRRYFTTFRQCASCGKVYWAGSHMAHMKEIISALDEGY